MYPMVYDVFVCLFIMLMIGSMIAIIISVVIEIKDRKKAKVWEMPKLNVQLDEYAIEPTRAHKTDAGLDLKSPQDFTIYPGGSATIRTGVHIQLPPGTCGLLVAKSGLNVKKDITSTGLIDEGYTGEIVVKLQNNSGIAWTFNRGDKISQLVVLPVLYCETNIVESLEVVSERGNNGFGSSGR